MRSNIFRICIISVFLIAWELCGRFSSIALFLFSRPSSIGSALVAMFTEGLWKDCGVTALEALVGSAMGTLLGSALGVTLWLKRELAKVVSPFIVAAANFPIFALAPAALVWFGVGMSLKYFLAAFATLFVSLNLSHRGAEAASELYSGIFEGFGANRTHIYRKAIIPGALGAVFSAMRVNIGLGILGAFVGEFVASDIGLGHSIVVASGLYQMDRVFAASFCIIVLAVLFDLGAKRIETNHLALARFFGVPRIVRTYH